MNKRIKKKHAGTSVEYKGYTALQNYRNHHVMIVKDGYMVAHSCCFKRLKRRQLKQEIERHIYFIEHMDEFFKKEKPKFHLDDETAKNIRAALEETLKGYREEMRELNDVTTEL